MASPEMSKIKILQLIWEIQIIKIKIWSKWEIIRSRETHLSSVRRRPGIGGTEGRGKKRRRDCDVLCTCVNSTQKECTHYVLQTCVHKTKIQETLNCSSKNKQKACDEFFETFLMVNTEKINYILFLWQMYNTNFSMHLSH